MAETRLPAATTPALVAAAHDAGLRYVRDDQPGIRRRRRGAGFVYVTPDGKRVTDPVLLARIKRLAVPPAWEDVWICPGDNGHIQAVGRDQRGRKQYRYHEKWRRIRDETKFHRMIAFAKALPSVRRRVARDLKRPGMCREKVVATVVRLLETTLIRVGNDEYARNNRSYGLTTMRNPHAKVKGERIFFVFQGKSGKRHEISLRDSQVARIVRRCQDLPGQELFCYHDAEGNVHDVGSGDVNDYIREITGGDFTAKDFRTWAGTVLAAIALQEFAGVASGEEAKRNVVTAIEAVARMLGNTPSVCRKCYVHPAILESYLEGTTIATLQQRIGDKIATSLRHMKPEEAAVLVLLQRRLRRSSVSGISARNA